MVKNDVTSETKMKIFTDDELKEHRLQSVIKYNQSDKRKLKILLFLRLNLNLSV